MLCWIVVATVFAPLAMNFSERIQSTLSGLRGSDSEVVRQNVVKNFSTALAFPTAIVWDAKGVPQDQADAAWQSVLDAVHADPKVNDITDGRMMVGKWPRQDWHAAFVAVGASTYGEAEKVVPMLRHDLSRLSFPTAGRPAVTGGPALFLDLNLASTDALRRGEMIALPITFLISARCVSLAWWPPCSPCWSRSWGWFVRWAC